MNIVNTVVDSILNTYPLNVPLITEEENSTLTHKEEVARMSNDDPEKFLIATMYGYYDIMAEISGDDDYLKLISSPDTKSDAPKDYMQMTHDLIVEGTVSALQEQFAANQSTSLMQTVANIVASDNPVIRPVDVISVIAAYLSINGYECPSDEEIIQSTFGTDLNAQPTDMELSIGLTSYELNVMLNMFDAAANREVLDWSVLGITEDQFTDKLNTQGVVAVVREIVDAKAKLGDTVPVTPIASKSTNKGKGKVTKK